MPDRGEPVKTLTWRRACGANEDRPIAAINPGERNSWVGQRGSLVVAALTLFAVVAIVILARPGG